MNQNECTLEICLTMVENQIYESTGQKLNSLKRNILICFWNGKTYKETYNFLIDIGLKYQFCYVSRDVGPNLLKNLSKALNITVNKYSFKRICELELQRNIATKLIQKQVLTNRFFYFLVKATKNNYTYAQSIKNKNCSLDYTFKSITFRSQDFEIMQATFENKTYKEMNPHIKRVCIDDNCKSFKECKCRYDDEYIGKIGKKLWSKVSAVLGKPVYKNHFKNVVEQWQKDMQLFVWKLIQVAISLEKTNLAFAKNCSKKTQLSDFYALIVAFLLWLEANN